MKSPDDIWVTPDPRIERAGIHAMAELLQRIGDMLEPYADEGHSVTLIDLLSRLLKELDSRRLADGQIDLNEYDVWD